MVTPSIQGESTELATRLQNLPTDLYNEIYQLTFTAPSEPETRKIDQTTQPSHLLNVSQNSREIYAESYFGKNSPFYINMYGAKRWVQALQPSHAAKIKEIRITGYKFYYSSTEFRTTMRAMRRMSNFYQNDQLRFRQLQWGRRNDFFVMDLFTWEVTIFAKGTCFRKWLSLRDAKKLQIRVMEARAAGGLVAYREMMEEYAESDL